MSPLPRGSAADAYGLSPNPSDNYSFDIPGLNQPDGGMESSPDPPMFSNANYPTIPRTAPMPSFVSRNGLPVSAALPLDNPPELIHTSEYSPWTSASESTYSTPNEQPSRRRHWRHAPQNSLGWQTSPDFLPPFSNATRHEINTSGGLETMATTQYYVSNGFPVSPHMAPAPHHTFDPLLSGAMMPDFAEEQSHALVDPSIGGHHASHQQRSSSVRRQTPEISIATSGQMADTLVTPAPLSSRIDSMAQFQQKDHVVENTNQDGHIGALGSIDGIPHWSGDSPGGSGILTGAGLKTGCGVSGVTILTPLPRSVRNAIPSYIEIYWERFHSLFPIVHRLTFEDHGEEVLKCSMAAIATQFSNSKEDRIRGGLLHEYAWQETKRVSQIHLPNSFATLSLLLSMKSSIRIVMSRLCKRFFCASSMLASEAEKRLCGPRNYSNISIRA